MWFQKLKANLSMENLLALNEIIELVFNCNDDFNMIRQSTKMYSIQSI
jgi:hypothetical protein